MVFAITAMLIVALVAVIAVVIHYSYLSLVHSELQSAADSAALAAASRLNSSRSGWNEAREAAIVSLGRSRAATSIGGDGSLAITDSSESPFWDLADEKNLQVRIERGQWRPALRDKPAEFRSFEEDWQNFNPGIPRYVAANSIRVLIERPKTRILGSPFGGVPEYDISASSIALRGPDEEVCSAPFAIPVCALLMNDGEFQKEKICKGDRLFTRADRYCPPETSDEECAEKTLPSISYTPTGSVYPDYAHGGDPGSVYLESLDEPLYWYPDSPNTEGPAQPLYQSYRDFLPRFQEQTPLPPTVSDNSYFAYASNAWNRQQHFVDADMSIWGYPKESSTKDHYGVFGMPTFYRNQEELKAAVSAVLARGTGGTGPCVPTRIGEQFSVLDSGLTAAADDDQIWNIINDSKGEFANSIPYSNTMLGSIESQIQTLSWEIVKYENGNMIRAPSDGDIRYQGICNNHRGRFEQVAPALRSYQFGPNDITYATAYRFALFDGIGDNSSVWLARVPIIAEPGQGVSSCRGVSSAGPLTDPSISGSKTYVIIGFVNAILYDVDIGHSPPNYPIMSFDGVHRIPFPQEQVFQENCNNLRGRVTCDSQFVPSSSTSGYASPRLVAGERVEP